MVTESSLLECYTPLARPSLSADQSVALEQLALDDRHRVRILNLLAAADAGRSQMAEALLRRLAETRAIRDEIASRVERLLAYLDGGEGSHHGR